MEIDLAERIKPGIFFLNVLGYQLILPQEFSQWEDMAIVNRQKEKIGNAYFSKKDVVILGKEANKNFKFAYNLKNYQDEDIITGNLNFNNDNINYRLAIKCHLLFPTIGKYAMQINLQVFQDNYRQFNLDIPFGTSKIIFDSFNQIKGHEHLEYNFLDNLAIIYELKNEELSRQTKARATNDQIITWQQCEYVNGVDTQKRFFSLDAENKIRMLSYYMLQKEKSYRLSLMELNNISAGLIGRIIDVVLPQYNEKEISFLFGIFKSPVIWQNEELSLLKSTPMRQLKK